MDYELNLQSPINLEKRAAKGAYMGNFEFENLFRKNFSTLTNAHDTVQVRLLHDVYLTGGPLRARYKLDHMHFHWGYEVDTGSEHKINGKRYSAEAHLVHTYDYKYRAPLDILEASKKLGELKYKIDHPDEEPEEDEDDEEEEEEEEDEDEEEMKERYIRDTKLLEQLEKRKNKEWVLERSKNFAEEIRQAKAENYIEPENISEQEKKNRELLRKIKERKERLNHPEFIPEWKVVWEKFKHDVKYLSNLPLPETVWDELEEKYANSNEAKAVETEIIKQKAKLPAEEETNAKKARRLEMEAMNRMEKVGLERSKKEYVQWMNVEDKVDKKLRRQLREEYEEFVEELEEREELEDEDEISEEEKRLIRMRWTVEDNKREEAINQRLKAVLDRRKKELDDICTTDIHCITVIALLFELDRCAQPFDVFSYVTRVEEPKSEIKVDGNLFLQLQNGLTNGQYFTYTGSLTTHPFTENVNWIVMRDPLPIRPAQLKLLKTIKSEFGPVEGNARAATNAGNREVFYSRGIPDTSEPPCPGKETCPCKPLPKRKEWTKYI